MSQQGYNESENKLHGERYNTFLDAIQTLYIRNNLGARIHFTKEWPAAAQHIFGAELLGYDADGVTDRERRAVLEDEAEGRRLELEEAARTLEDKSVNKGALQLEYVGPLVKSLGRELALILYSPRIVDRFIPPPAPPAPKAEEIRPQEAVSAAAAPVEKPVPPPVPQPVERPIVPISNSMDHVMPISVEPRPQPVPAAPVAAPTPTSLPEADTVTITPPAPAVPVAAPLVAPFAPAHESQTIKPVVPKFDADKTPGETSGG